MSSNLMATTYKPVSEMYAAWHAHTLFVLDKLEMITLGIKSFADYPELDGEFRQIKVRPSDAIGYLNRLFSDVSHGRCSESSAIVYFSRWQEGS